MDVYLLPVMPAPPGAEPPFELYCEPPPDPEPEPGSEVKPGFFGRMALRFKQALAEGEEEERRHESGEPDEAPKDFGGRVGRYVKRKLAAAVAEQRVLWHLRHATAARLHHPVTITSPRAIEIATAEFKKDYSKHWRWFIIDAVILVLQAPLVVLPGPNVVGIYFIFRSVGHFFSYQGARKGMEASLWTGVPSAPLADLQEALSLDPAPRAQRIETIADTLGLERLSVFMRRVDDRPRKT
ncbi:MAG TPA: hypothetical protein VMZ90_02445 [Vicinamibacterales bacterium]|nr:hypothetical protein [Vicinamibacterales bacterium]